MIVILKHEARQEQIDRLKQFLLGMGLRIDESKGENSTILGLVGDTTRVDADLISSLDAVEAVRRVQEPYKKANRKFHPQDTMVDCGGVTIGHGLFQIIAGPCSVESEEQMVTVAKAVKAAGADGLMIEVHNDPKHALCDGAQSLTPDEFADVVRRVKGIRAVVEE